MGIRSRMILAFSGVVLLASSVGLYLTWSTTRAYFLEQTRDSLKRLASTMAHSLDGDALRGLTALDRNTEAYQAAKNRFRQFRAAVPDARFIYFYRPSERPAVMELVVDGLEENEAGAILESEANRYYDTLENDSPRMVDGLREPAADDELVKDAEGVWLSGYAPVYDKSGAAVGAVGLDLPAADIHARQDRLLRLLIYSSAAALFVAWLVGLFLAKAIAQPVQRLAEVTHALAGGDLTARVHLERSDEIGRLGQDFNHMAGNLEAMADALQRYTTEALETHEEKMAIELQRVLLPADELQAPGAAVSASLRPVPWGGGDTYQYFLFGSGAYLMLSFGHVRASGLEAAALVTLVQSRLAQLISNLVLRPGEILGELSRTLRSAGTGLAPMDYACAVYDLERRWLALGTAGEVLVYLLRPSTGQLERLESGTTPPLGQAEAALPDMDLEVSSGDRLVVLSAYAVAATSPEQEAFGFERLEQTLRHHANQHAAELREALLAEICRHAGENGLADDLSVVVAELGQSSRNAEAAVP